MSRDFDTLFTKARPHIFEKICLSLDYKSFKTCLEVNKAWRGALTSTPFQKKAKFVFGEEISKDEKELQTNSNKGETEEVRNLLSIGLVDVNCVDGHGATPLCYDASKGQKDLVQLLLERGADLNNADKRGWTLLHWAAENRHKHIVRLLLDNGADPNRENKWGHTPLHYAKLNGQVDVVCMLEMK